MIGRAPATSHAQRALHAQATGTPSRTQCGKSMTLRAYVHFAALHIAGIEVLQTRVFQHQIKGLRRYFIKNLRNVDHLAFTVGA
jgi:hypothetical protein